jgi:1-phosphofructokinase family hexose kinase
MIITVTLNPSIDRTISVSDLKRGGVNRADLIAIDAAGKGVNVSRALSAYGKDTHAILIGAALGSEWMANELNKHSISHTMVMAPGITRSNITMVEADGTVTKINEPGVVMTPEILDAVKSALAAQDLAGNWVVFAGRLNPGAAEDTYADLVSFCKARGAKVVLDASGASLNAALKESAPDLIKPNQHELGGVVGRELNTISEVIDAAREVMALGVGSVLCSLGKDGALYVTDTDVVHVEPLDTIVGTPVGAGDILLATFLAGGANVDALEGAVQWSAASVKLPGTGIPTHELAAEIRVRTNREIDGSRALREVA